MAASMLSSCKRTHVACKASDTHQLAHYRECSPTPAPDQWLAPYVWEPLEGLLKSTNYRATPPKQFWLKSSWWGLSIGISKNSKAVASLYRSQENQKPCGERGLILQSVPACQLTCPSDPALTRPDCSALWPRRPSPARVTSSCWLAQASCAPSSSSLISVGPAVSLTWFHLCLFWFTLCSFCSFLKTNRIFLVFFSKCFWVALMPETPYTPVGAFLGTLESLTWCDTAVFAGWVHWSFL